MNEGKNEYVDSASGTWLGRGSNHPEFSSTDVHFSLWKDEKTAEDEFFLIRCENVLGGLDASRLTTGASGDNQYCYSYKQQYRDPPDVLCLPTEAYGSQVVFRKGKLIIHLSEYTFNKDSRTIDEVIKFLAEAMRKHDPNAATITENTPQPTVPSQPDDETKQTSTKAMYLPIVVCEP